MAPLVVAKAEHVAHGDETEVDPYTHDPEDGDVQRGLTIAATAHHEGVRAKLLDRWRRCRRAFVVHIILYYYQASPTTSPALSTRLVSKRSTSLLCDEACEDAYSDFEI